MNHLNIKRVTAGLLLISIAVACYVSQLYYQQATTEKNTQMLAFPVSFTVNYPIADQLLTTNSTRIQILNYITANPGIQFRGICNGLCLPVGLVQYHIGVLVKSGLVSFFKDGRYKRFFATKKFSKSEMHIISVLRHKTARKIVETLLNKKQLPHGKLASEVFVTSPALTWQMKTLCSMNFLVHTSDGFKTLYSLDEACIPQLRYYLSLIKQA